MHHSIPSITALIILIGSLASQTSAAALVNTNIESSHQYHDQRIESRLIVNNFMHRVDDGEVSVFGQTLSRDMLYPIKVSREYHFAKDQSHIKIFARLRQPMTIPETERLVVKTITVSITMSGEITEVEAHATAY